jgi:hypothetical protein
MIQADGVNAGWALLANLPHEIRIVEFMVAPEIRGQGIGAAALRKILATGAESGKPGG